MRSILILFVSALVVFGAANYGGMRSPDSEIVYRVGESIAAGRGFVVERDLQLWRGFGVSPGRGGRQYAIFGPLQSVAAAPLIAGASLINDTRWYDDADWLPVSFYSGRGLVDYLRLNVPENREPHARRFLVSFFNALVSALCVVVFWLIARVITQSVIAAFAGTLLFGSGTLLWPYAGTFFSEPLATLLVLLSFQQLAAGDPAFVADGQRGTVPRRMVLAGVCLGLATTAHLTAILFFPFFALYAWYAGGRNTAGRNSLNPLLLFSTGVLLMLALLGAYNFARFGDVFQTGRSVGMTSIVTTEYSRFVAPWRGLWALLVSPGKGLFLYCPAVIAGLVAWRGFHRGHPFLSCTLAGAVLLRLVFIASRSDWHGGFSLGPRYLLMLIPFLILPVLFWLREQVAAKRARPLLAFMLFSFVCASQQLYFLLGELFSSYQLMKMTGAERGVNIFANDRIYLDWHYSPLLKLAHSRLAPFWLHARTSDPVSVWLAGAVLLAAGFAIAAILVARRLRAVA